MRRAPSASFAASFAALALIAGCASPPPATPPIGERVFGSIALDGRVYAAEWLLPVQRAPALVVLEHGFARRCANLRGTAAQFTARGLIVLCLDGDVALGNPALAVALSRALAGAGLTAPGGRTLPPAIIVAGHSAGALFAAYLGAALARAAPERLAGALLLDPVAGDGLAAALRAIADDGRRPVLAILAAPGRCNAHNDALPVLRALAATTGAAGGRGFAGVQRGPGSTHLDAEGEDTDLLGVLACGQGRPQPAQTARLRELVAGWAAELAVGASPTFDAAADEAAIDAR